MSEAANLVFTIFTYLFFGLMLVVCVVAALMIRRLLTGTPRKLGMIGFLIVAFATLSGTIRSIYTDATAYDSINYNVVYLIDVLNSFIRLAGIILIGLALLATARDLKQLFSGSRAAETPAAGTGYGSLPPREPQPGQQSLPPQPYQPSRPTNAAPYPQGQPSASQPYPQSTGNGPQATGSFGQQPYGQPSQPWQGNAQPQAGAHQAVPGQQQGGYPQPAQQGQFPQQGQGSQQGWDR